ncbi:RimJ/RimL family protein N-acetyltransferase [Conyzicola lurida]|uniref:RimJ/RimL family protein N-acetyltransferase n=1 Tax=Conyzicola lurida TaxID=1172621 RepID=A0A841AR77_9MICO|nr:GNAT family N-acetyltransferase [Conyzicola lurida]MBB5844281.1 RimJ/RimL family protein N-acetyltransferase [Conyzicola lurida]
MIPAVIRSERLTLDALLPSDADAIYRYCQDVEIQRWVHIPSPYSRADAGYFATTYAEDAASSDTLTLWAIRSAEGVLLGVIELRFEPVGSATVGYWLGREHRGQSLMTEALQALVEYALDPLGLDLVRIHWNAFVGNFSSAHVARGNGFHFEGTLRQSIVHRDHRVDAWEASLLRSDDRERQDGWPL